MSEIEAFSEVQIQQRAWVKHNFGDRPSFHPLLGVIEEFGELADAHFNNRAAEAKDSLGDIVIFACDYASASGWEIADLVRMSEFADVPFDSGKWFCFVVKQTGRLAHAHLKEAQGIRLHEDHEKNARWALAYLIGAARAYAQSSDWVLEDLVLETWLKVRERDWKANRETAHKG